MRENAPRNLKGTLQGGGSLYLNGGVKMCQVIERKSSRKDGPSEGGLTTFLFKNAEKTRGAMKQGRKSIPVNGQTKSS